MFNIADLFGRQGCEELGVGQLPPESKIERVKLFDGTEIDCPILHKFDIKGYFGKYSSKILNKVFYKWQYVEIKVLDTNNQEDRVLVKITDLAKRYKIDNQQISDAANRGVLENLIRVLSHSLEVEEFSNRLRKQFQFHESQRYYDFVTSQNEHIRTEFTKEDLEVYVSAVVMFKFTSPVSTLIGTTEEILSHRVRVPSGVSHLIKIGEGTEEKIIALFGKVLGAGGYAIVTHTVDVEQQSLTESIHPMAAYRTAHGEHNQEQIEASLRGVRIIRDLHRASSTGRAVGIQSTPTVVKDKLNHHLGFLTPKYEGSLAKESINLAITLSLALEAGYQLTQGLAQMHRIGIAHRDIKLDNILVNRGASDAEWQFHHSDFDGAVLHDGKVVNELGEYTTKYRPKEDSEAYHRALSNEDFVEMQTIDEKGDLFALASVMYLLIVKEFPFIADKDDHPTFDLKPEKLRENLSEYLTNKPQIIDVIVKGLSKNYRDRPTADEFAACFIRHLA